MTDSAPPPAQATTSAGDMTQLLQAWRSGSAEVFAHIVQSLHGEFLRMAGARLRGHDAQSLSRGDVVNEALMRLMAARTDWANRAHFFATVSLTMRSVLREHARARLAGQQRLPEA